MDSGYGSYAPQGQPSSQSNQGSTSVFVGGLAFAATEDDLRHALSSAGRIVGCRIVTDRETGRSKGFGFVDFESEADRDSALRNFNGIDICGRPIRLDAGGRGKGGSAGGKGYGARGGDYNRGGDHNRGGDYNRSAGEGGFRSDNRQSGYGGPTQQHAYGGGGYSRYPEAQQQPSSQAGSTSGYQNSTSHYRRDTEQQGGYKSGGAGGYQSGGYQSGGYQSGGNRPGGQDQSRTQSYSGHDDRRDRYQPRSSGGYGAPSKPNDDWKRDQGRYGRDRSRSRERSPSVSSSARERRHRERQSRKEKFAAQNSAGWDRAPNQDEIAQQEAERAAVRAAEATGKDITTIRADLLKQAQWQQQHGYH